MESKLGECSGFRMQLEEAILSQVVKTHGKVAFSPRLEKVMGWAHEELGETHGGWSEAFGSFIGRLSSILSKSWRVLGREPNMFNERIIPVARWRIVKHRQSTKLRDEDRNLGKR